MTVIPQKLRLPALLACTAALATTGATAFAAEDAAAEAAKPTPAKPAPAAAAQPASDKDKKVPVEKVDATKKTAEEDVYVMSPFEVTAEKDVGYQASNTMSGTRLNSKLEDLGAAITVVTKQQLLDTASVDINDIFLNEGNVEGTYQYSDLSVATIGGQQFFVDNSGVNPQSANRVRGLGAANISRGGVAGVSSVPIDSYNIDAVEISRGPNSSIFGIGNPSGTVNVVGASANTTRQITNVTVRGDSYGGFRSSFDVNRPLIQNSLAVRVLGVYEEKGFVRKPSDDKTRRLQFAVTAKPFKNTTIKASYETYHNYNSRPNSITPRDYVTPWIDAGMPTWDPMTWTVKKNGTPVVIGGITQTITQANDFAATATTPRFVNNPGIGYVSNGIYSRMNMWVDNGEITYISVGRRADTISNTLASIPNPFLSQGNVRYLTSWKYFEGAQSALFVQPGITNQSLYDWEKINFAAANWSKAKSDNYRVEVEQFFLTSQRHLLGMQLGFVKEQTDSYSRSIIGTSDGAPATVVIDINERLLDGSINPYFGRPMVTGNNPQMFRRPEDNTNYRGTIAYQLDLTHESNWTKWLGKHMFAGYGEQREIINSPNGFRYQDMLTDAWYVRNTASVPPQTTYAAGGNGSRFFEKYYIGDASGYNVDYGSTKVKNYNGPVNYTWYNGATNPVINPAGPRWVTEPAQIKELWFSQGLQKREIRTEGIIWQGFLLKDRIIPTIGYRKDRARSVNGRAETYDANGYPVLDTLDDWQTNWVTAKGDTNTKGIVVKPFSWLFFHYNKSDSFEPATVSYDLFGNVNPNPQGKGKDYGFTLSLLDGKFVAKVNKYNNVQRYSRNGATAVLATRPFRIDFDTSGTAADYTLGGDSDLEDAFALWVAAPRFGIAPTAAAFNALPEATRAGIYQEIWATKMGPNGGFLTLDFTNWATSGVAFSDVNTVTSKGLEVELNYNPSKYWTVKANITKQQAVDTDLSEKIKDYINLRLDFWKSVVIPTTSWADATTPTTTYTFGGAGTTWWNNFRDGSAATPADFYAASVDAPYALAVANSGKPRSQTREWRVNVTTNYKLAGMFADSFLKNASVGGSLRWEDQASIGFLGQAPDADGVIRRYDANKPVFDKSRFYADLMFGYNFRMMSDKIRCNVQLNVRNVLENGRLQPFGINPDGTPVNFRIIDPRQFILSASFDL